MEEPEDDQFLGGQNRQHRHEQGDADPLEALPELAGGSPEPECHRRQESGDREEKSHAPEVQPEDGEVEAEHRGIRVLQEQQPVVRNQEQHHAASQRVDVVQPAGLHVRQSSRRIVKDAVALGRFSPAVHDLFRVALPDGSGRFL
ncbi:MAG: hypothetical protein JJE13_04890 [Thermoleophilia bacterium]|nr:hypothetical protein [Thermoleophilia bacterium]